MNLSAKPFHLSKSDIAWVEKTRDALSIEDKIRQLFIHITVGDDLANITRLSNMKPGGLHRFTGAGACRRLRRHQTGLGYGRNSAFHNW